MKKTSKKRKYGFKLILLLLTVSIILGGGYFFTFNEKSMESWIKEKDEKVVAHLNKAADYFSNRQFLQAEKEFERAYDTAKIADREGSILWQEKISLISPPRKFFTGDPANRASRGSVYFKNRMIEAIYGYASTVNWQVNNKYAQKINEEFNENNQTLPIPENEYSAALKAIEEGLKIDPKSEILRILKAEILTSTTQYNEAIALLNEVTTLINSDSAEAYNQLGIIYSKPTFLNTDNYNMYREKAIAMFEKASLLPTINGGKLADPNFNLGMYYSTPSADRAANALPSVADARKAISYFEKYLELADDESTASDIAKERIETLRRIVP